MLLADKDTVLEDERTSSVEDGATTLDEDAAGVGDTMIDGMPPVDATCSDVADDGAAALLKKLLKKCELDGVALGCEENVSAKVGSAKNDSEKVVESWKLDSGSSDDEVLGSVTADEVAVSSTEDDAEAEDEESFPLAIRVSIQDGVEEGVSEAD